MYSKNNKRMIIQKKQEKINYYGIKKFKVGTASVLIAAGFAFLGTNAFASDNAENSTALATDKPSPDTKLNTDNNTSSRLVEKDETKNLKAGNVNSSQPKVEKQLNKTELENSINRLQAAIEKAGVNDKTKSFIEEAKLELASAQNLEQDSTATQEEINRKVVELKNKAFVLESMKKVSTEPKEEKVNKNNDPRNGKAIPGKGESGFRADTTVNPIIPAKEGPTNNNKLGSGNNPADGVFESAKNQFGDIDFSNAKEKNREVRKQWSRSTASQGGKTEILGSLTYNWKEKEITADDANNRNALNGWKIEGGEKVTAIKPEAPTNVSSNRPAGFDPTPSKIYDLNGVIPQRDNEVPAPGNPLGVNAANQNYANGVNHSGVVGTHNLPKGYYLELGKKGTKISKEYPVNGNSRVLLSAITGGAYGNAGTAGTGERIKITVYDAATGEKISSIRDDRTIGEKMESEHISTPTGSGGNGDGWTEYRAIYEIPKTTTRVKVEIEALNDGTAINNSYLQNSNRTISDGYFVGAVNLALGTGTEMTTNVKSNRQEGKYGEDSLYKSKQTGEFEFTVNSVGGIRLYGSSETEIEIPEGVELPDNIKKPTGWVWFGDTPIASQNIAWDPATRKLRIKYNSSKSNNGDSPYIGVGSNNGQNDGVRKFRVPFTTADNYRGTATFKVKTFLPNGLNDAQNNKILNTGDVSNANGIYHPVVDGLRNTDKPDYYYNKTIYIDTVKPVAPTVEPVHTDSINGEKTDKNQVKELLVSLPTEKNTELTNEARERKDIADNDANNGTNRNADTEVKNIERAIGGLTSLKVTLPNTKTPITLTKKADGWYNGATKVEVRDGKLVVPVPAGTDLTEANETTNPDKRIKVTVLDKAGNESDPAYANVLNEAPTVAVEKKDLYVYKTKEADKWNNAKVLEKAKPSATDLEDDRDGVESTKPTIAVSDSGNLDTTTVGNYTVKVQSTDSEGKKSTEADVTVHVLDLIKVDPTVTTDPTNPSTTSPVSPKTADTPVKEGDENLGKYPAGVTRDDLVKEVTRTIKYLKEEDANKDDATPLYAEKVQKVTYKRTATVNPETKEVTYSDWEVYNEADKLTDAKADGTKGKYNSVESPVINNYLLVDNADKLVPEKDAPKPAQNGTVSSEVKKVLYKEIGSFVPEYPAGKKPQGAPEKINYPNHSTDPTIPGDFSTVTIPYVPGYTPVYNGRELTPKNPNDPTQGYNVPEGFAPADNFGTSPITYTPSTQKAKVVIEKKVDGGANEVVSSFDLTGKSGSELPASTDVDNKIKELKNQGYEVESDEYHTQDNHHPIFDDKEDVNPTDGSSAPSQTFKIVVKPRIVEVPSSTPHEKDSPVDPNGENPELKWPEGLAESDLNTTAKRVISYVKKDSDTAPEVKAKDDTVQTVPFTRKASVNLVTKEVTYTDWESPNKTWDKVGVDVLPGYIADKKEIPAKEAVTPAKDTKVIPDETDKVTYTKIGSWIPVDPTTGRDGDPIPFPNDPNDPTKTGEITQIIPHKDGYTPKDGNGIPLEPVNPANPEQGYKPPKITDPKANIKITYEKDDQKAKVKFVSVDDKGVETPLDTKYNIEDLAGKSGDKIPEEKVQARIEVLKSMGYDVVDNPFDQDPTFDTKKEIDQEFTIKVKPQVSTAKPVYVVEGDKPSSEKLKDAVTTKGNEKTVDETKLPDTTDKVGDETLTAPVTVTYGSGDNKREEIVNVPIKVVEGYPQIVPVDPKTAPKAEDSIDPADYPEGAKFTYEKDPDTSSIGDKPVKVIVTDKEGNELVRVPATVRVVDSKPQFVVADPKKPQPDVKSSITPEEYPEGTKFKYKEPVDTTTSGEKDVVVVAELDGKTIVEVPAKVMVVNPKTQYVFEDPAKPQPSAEESIDPDQYPEGTKFTYKDGDVDTTTPGDKKVTVVAKDGEDKLVEVPAVVKVLPLVKPEGLTVLKGSENLEAAVKAKAEEVVAALPKDKLPEGVTVKVKEVKAGTTPTTAEVTETGKPKPATVVIEYTDDKGNVVGTKEVEVPVTVVGSTPKPVVVFEGEKPTKAKDAVTPGQGGTVGEPTTLPETAGKAGATDVTVEVPVTYPGVKDSEKVTVPVTVLPVAKGEVTVAKNTTPDKLKELAKAKAEEAVQAKDFTDKLPKGATVTVGDVTKAIEDTVTAKKGTGVTTVEVPVTYTVDGKDYTTTIPVTVNVKGSDVKPVYVVEGDKPKADDVNKAITPDTDGTKTPVTDEDINKAIPTTEGKVGDKDVNVTTKVTYPNNVEEPVTVPVTVLPKVKPEGVVVPKNSDKTELAKVVKEKAEEAAKKLEGLPEGVTVTVTNVETTPGTDKTGEQTPATVTVEYKDKDGNKITKVIEVPVNVVEAVPTPVETPVTNTPLAKEDIAKYVKVPEGGKVTNVENIPDLTTPGKKDPVKVTVTLPNGKTITVEVPVNVTPVKEIETPVTKTPLTPEDYTKGIKIPEGGKVTNVENIPDLTTPGKKDPVKVTVELPNGKVITVEVPVNVTPVKPIETPVTSTPLTPEDYTKGIKIPEGGKVTNVENIPDLTTPGKKDPVKVTVELPNGKVITVEVPVTVTPINDIVKNVGDPITNEDVEKNVKIPEGGKIVSIGDKPGTDTPGVKPVVPVVIELPNGKQITVEVPVIVKPKVTPVVVPVGTPVTPEDVKKHIDLPEGWKITKVGEIPTTTTPGAKPSVTVEVELPDGRKITVEVPVIVTPKVSTIIVPQGTPITKDDVKNHIDLPKEPGWEIVEIGEIPSTIPAGVKPSVKVKVKLPNGKVIELEVPVISTPKVTPIEVEVGTPITKDDVKKHIELPKEPGWEIVEVGEIPTTETPGQKTAVKVKVKLPTGEIVELEVPVTVTPKATPAPRPTVKTTPIVVEVGTPITKEDVIKHVELPKGAEIVEVGEIPTTETAGQKASVKVKVKLPTGEIIEVEVPVTVTPKKETPALRPEKPSTPEVPATPEAPKAPVAKAGEKVLPNTGIADKNSALAGLGLAILGLVGLRRRRKQK